MYKKSLYLLIFLILNILFSSINPLSALAFTVSCPSHTAHDISCGYHTTTLGTPYTHQQPHDLSYGNHPNPPSLPEAPCTHQCKNCTLLKLPPPSPILLTDPHNALLSPNSLAVIDPLLSLLKKYLSTPYFIELPLLSILLPIHDTPTLSSSNSTSPSSPTTTKDNAAASINSANSSINNNSQTSDTKVNSYKRSLPITTPSSAFEPVLHTITHPPRITNSDMLTSLSSPSLPTPVYFLAGISVSAFIGMFIVFLVYKLRILSLRITKLVAVGLATLTLSSIFFLLLYLYDNKYTYPSPRQEQGITYLEGNTLQESPLTFLIRQWEYYPDQLLTPSDFKEGLLVAPSYAYIGQYDNFFHSNQAKSLHGVASYRMTLKLPDTPSLYTLEIPEIFSSYKLYLDDSLALQVGVPEDSTYSDRVQNRTLTFYGHGELTILLAVANWSHFYSGMVYPMALGTPHTIDLLQAIRQFLIVGIFCLSLISFIASTYLYTHTKERDRKLLLFTLLCLSVAGYTSYGVIHRYFTTSIQPWYAIELLCTYTTVLLIITLQNHVCGINKKIGRITSCFAGTFCLIAFIIALNASTLSTSIALAFAGGTSMFKVATALYLLATSLYSVRRQPLELRTLLCSSVFYSVAIIADRICPYYEPIVGSYFWEWGGLVMIIVLGYNTWSNVASTYGARLSSNREMSLLKSQLEAEKTLYLQLQDKITEARHLRHDHKAHLLSMGIMLQQKEYDRLTNYLEEYTYTSNTSTPLVICEHFVCAAIFSSYQLLAKQHHIAFSCTCTIPKTLPIPDTLLSSILGNLLSNAFEAVLRQKEGERFISIKASTKNTSLLLSVKNSFDGTLNGKNGRYYSSKRSSHTFGEGIASSKRTATHWGGYLDVEGIDGVFTAFVSLPINKRSNQA